MNILAVSDVEKKSLWDYYDDSMLADVDLIISCGDLKTEYLEFLVTMANCPLLYVRGNHDDALNLRPPEGCICIEDTVYHFKGLRILGLGGSMRYKNGENQFTEKQMQRRIRKLALRLRRTNGFDILVTHAPAKGCGDLNDLAHQGFDCFNDLLMRYQPQYMLHGHVHKSYGGFVREREHPSHTHILNVWESAGITIQPKEQNVPGRTGSFLQELSGFWHLKRF